MQHMFDNSTQIQDLVSMYFKPQTAAAVDPHSILVQKVEKLFKDEHLLTDVQMLTEIRKHNGTYISIAFLLCHEEVRKLNLDKNKLSNLLRAHSKLLELNKDGSMVRRVEPVTDVALEPLVQRSLLVENLPELLASSQTLTGMFANFGKVSAVNVYHPLQVKKTQGTSNACTPQPSQCPFAVVLFENQTDADKTIQMMSEEHERRFGLNVQKMPFPKLPVLNNPGKKFVRINFFVNKDEYVSVELVMVQGYSGSPAPQQVQPAFQQVPAAAIASPRIGTVSQQLPSQIHAQNQAVRRLDQVRGSSSLTHDAVPFVPRSDSQFPAQNTPAPPYTPRQNHSFLGQQRSLGGLSPQLSQNSNNLFQQNATSNVSVNNLSNVNNLISQNNVYQQAQNNLLQQRQNNTASNISLEDVKTLQNLLRGIGGFQSASQTTSAQNNSFDSYTANNEIQKQLLMRQQNQMASRLSSMPINTSAPQNLQQLFPQFSTPRSTSLSPPNTPWQQQTQVQQQELNIARQVSQQQQLVKQLLQMQQSTAALPQQSVPSQVAVPQSSVPPQVPQQFVPQLLQMQQNTPTVPQQVQSPQATPPQTQRSLSSHNQQQTSLQLNTVRRSTSAGSSSSSASTLNGPVTPLSPASTLPISENKPYLFNNRSQSAKPERNALKEMLSAWETADTKKVVKEKEVERPSSPTEPSPWMTVPTGFQSVQARNQRQQGRKDYASWAAATPENRAAKYQPPQDDRRSASADVNSWISRQSSQSSTRLSPRMAPVSRPQFASRGDSAEQQVKIAKTPDGTRGFAAGRGRSVFTANS